jgi:Permease for cytosine/purines, uracil, thiamine, allantoin
MDPPNHGAHQIPENDVEKWGELEATEINVSTEAGSDTLNQNDIPPNSLLLKGKLAKWSAKVERLAGLEARGITRVLPEEKHYGDTHAYLQMVALWFSINLVATNIITGLLGPLVFQLGWVDCVCIVIFANALSACGASYTSTFGPESGNRTMVRLRAEWIPQTRWR